MSNIQLWEGPNGISLPKKVTKPSEVVPFAHYLSEKQKTKIVAAFEIDAYDMAAEYAWKKAMVKLKETIATLGMKFVGEMLQRTDITESSSVENVLTDHSAIQLAEQLGVIGNTAALKLRQGNELITHFFSKDTAEEIDYNDAFTIVKSSIQYILGEQDISIAIEFSKFRDRVLSETLKSSDQQVLQLIGSPLFYIRTVNTILLSSIKSDIGAKQEHALANFNMLIEEIWDEIGEIDKWNIGSAYRDVTAAGNHIAAQGLKNALLKVSGFDYVPENLRSLTFKNTAKELLETHFAYNNFYNEPSVVKKLASLGTTIPRPALIDCIQAYLAVYLGNSYGTSTKAAEIAEEQLADIPKDRWLYYFSKVLINDEVILLKFNTTRQKTRFKDFLKANSLDSFTDLPKEVQFLYDSLLKGNFNKVTDLANTLYFNIKQKKK